MPHEVSRDDANAYVQWLHSRRFGLDEIRLHRNPDRAVEAKIYSYVRTRPGTNFQDIKKHLLADPEIVKVSTKDRGKVLSVEEDSEWGLDILLAEMVERKLLKRSPTMAELRSLGEQDGVNWSRAGIDFRPDPEIYRYFPDEHTEARGEDRASTVLRRIATLSSLWRHWAERGENSDGAVSLLKYNIWGPLVQDEADLAPSRQQIYRQGHTPTLEHWQALVATTSSRSLDDIRDRAILMLLFWQGLRVQELCNIQRKHRVIIDGMNCVRVRRKNGRVQHLVLEPESLAALEALDLKIMELAEAAEIRSRSASEKYEMATGKTNAHTLIPRWRRVLENPEAPLIPILRRWGSNAVEDDRKDEERPLTRQAVAMMLRRRAALPQNPENPDSQPVVPKEDWPKIHPHGFRHLSAKEARRSGADVAIIQASLGHESIATTSRYVEEHDIQRIRLFSNVQRESESTESGRFGEERQASPAPKRKQRNVIDVYGASFSGRLSDEE